MALWNSYREKIGILRSMSQNLTDQLFPSSSRHKRSSAGPENDLHVKPSVRSVPFLLEGTQSKSTIRKILHRSSGILMVQANAENERAMLLSLRLETAIFPRYFHGKCQDANGVDAPGCPNPDCPKHRIQPDNRSPREPHDPGQQYVQPGAAGGYVGC
ncbi:hypothetical protein AZE42_10786 [Rhizopogon vesiculosus]|uniref:Uncharacterized protein n=1 Tax=Rhizopogon vesiculosus TaxID=180088 RepID=A0A1J8QC19_9AGAM|nr:hypothetical protein AZE42_10786 [Rhizopogon vesiculosus]